MARRILQPIDDHNDGITCSMYYTVKFKLSSDSEWTYLLQQQPVMVESPLSYYILISNLEDDVNYDIEIIRHCCEGTTSVAATDTILTTP